MPSLAGKTPQFLYPDSVILYPSYRGRTIVIRVPKPEDLSEEQRKHWMALSGRG